MHPARLFLHSTHTHMDTPTHTQTHPTTTTTTTTSKSRREKPLCGPFCTFSSMPWGAVLVQVAVQALFMLYFAHEAKLLHGEGLAATFWSKWGYKKAGRGWNEGGRLGPGSFFPFYLMLMGAIGDAVRSALIIGTQWVGRTGGWTDRRTDRQSTHCVCVCVCVSVWTIALNGILQPKQPARRHICIAGWCLFVVCVAHRSTRTPAKSLCLSVCLSVCVSVWFVV